MRKGEEKNPERGKSRRKRESGPEAKAFAGTKIMATEKPRKAREEGCGKRGGRRAKAKKAEKGALKRSANTNLGAGKAAAEAALKR